MLARLRQSNKRYLMIQSARLSFHSHRFSCPTKFLEFKISPPPHLPAEDARKAALHKAGTCNHRTPNCTSVRGALASANTNQTLPTHDPGVEEQQQTLPQPHHAPCAPPNPDRLLIAVFLAWHSTTPPLHSDGGHIQ